MKHIKLFEAFGSPANRPVIQATGDWSKLSMDGTPIDWVYPSTFMVTYYTNPTETLIKKATDVFGEFFDDDYPLIDPDQAVDDIMGGDQGGSYITKEDGIVTLIVDPAYSPEDYKNELQNQINMINADPGAWEEDMCQSLLEDPELKLTPEFLSHCKAVVSGSRMGQEYISKYPQYYRKHPEILPGGDKSKIKIMRPRISLVFKVV